MQKINRDLDGYIHKEMASGRWFGMPFVEQMANVGSEVERAIKWRDKDEKIFRAAYIRMLELLGLTIEDVKNKKRLRELCRVREALNDFFLFNNIYSSTDKLWQNYFYCFAIARINLKEGNYIP